MARNEWEHGHITFTKTGYMQTLRAVRTAYNVYINEMMTRAFALHAELATITGRGAQSKQKALMAERLTFDFKRDALGCMGRRKPMLKPKGHYRVFQLTFEHYHTLQQELFRGKQGQLTKPRKSAFPTLTNKQTGFSLDCDDGYMTLNAESNQWDWSVDSNNHAVDDARSSTGWALLSGVLNDYQWRKGEGGLFFGGDEHARDAAHDNGEGYEDYPTSDFGPKGKQLRDAYHRGVNARFRAMHA